MSSPTTTQDEHPHHGHHGDGHDAGPSRKRLQDVFGPARHAKVGMWMYLLTDGMTFAGFLLGYALTRTRIANWPHPADILGLEISGFMTFLLICSSVTMVLAQARGEMKDRKGMVKFLVLTILGGVAFLAMQAYEYNHLHHEFGMTLANFEQGPPQFASTFFMVTGFHGLHVLSGVIYLTIILCRALLGKYDNGDVNEVEVAGLFWHFVDLVWILVFTFMYLV